MSSIPTMFEILSWYLYGQQTKPEDYLDEKYIGRPVNNDTDKIGSVVYVNATEFMTTGAGRYVDVGNFKAVRKFLAGEYNLAPKTYTTEQFFDAIGYPDYKTNKGAHLGVCLVPPLYGGMPNRLTSYHFSQSTYMMPFTYPLAHQRIHLR